jgi:7-cyano-7-deazaguanine synthase
MTKAVALCSGGMDSVTMCHMLRQSVDELHILSFNYGQRHKKELDFAVRCARDLGADWNEIELSHVGNLLKGSALSDPEVDVPEGHYADETMRLTVVPNRNSIMLSIAVGVAVAEKANYVAAAMHAGDHPVYPDCRPTFVSLFSQTMQIANEGFVVPAFTVEAPFIHMSKAEIVQVGFGLDRPVDYAKTWSCYRGKDIHCGRCSTCVERAEAFHLAGYVDPTTYRDPTYWRTVTGA